MARPIQYHLEDVLQKAMQVFWKQGYEGTSLDDLTKATGLGRGSLYNAFESKYALYLRALDHYSRQEVAGAVDMLRQGSTARESLTILFNSIIERVHVKQDRRGCLLCNAAIDLAGQDETIAARVQHHYLPLRNAFQALLEAETPDVKAGTAAEQADQLLAVYMGLQVMSRGGYPAQVLRHVVDVTLSQVP